MAEGETTVVDLLKGTDAGDKAIECLECAVCLQTCIHPAQLPCGHIFCFLCIKGIANQSKKCAMCRQEIPRDFIEHPNLLRPPDASEAAVENYDGNYQWFYEGRNGWWQYDERSSKELETCYKAGERTCELLIAGFLYVTDLVAMLQLRRNDPTRRRRIKRDLATIPKKGIAGLWTDSDPHPHQELLHPEPHHHRPHSPTEGQMDNLTPITPSNTPQSPTSGRESPQQNDLQATMDRIQSLHLEDNNNPGGLRREGEESRGHNDESPHLQVGQRNVFQFRHRNVD